MDNNDFTYEFVQSVYNDMNRFLQSLSGPCKQTDLTTQITGDKYPQLYQFIQNIRNSGQSNKRSVLITFEINPEAIKKSSTLTQQQGAYWYLSLIRSAECCLTRDERQLIYDALQMKHPSSDDKIYKNIISEVYPYSSMDKFDRDGFFYLLFDQVHNRNNKYPPIEFIKEFQRAGLNEICKLLEKALLGYKN